MTSAYSDPATWAIQPFETVGPLDFGMLRDDVIRVLGEPHSTDNIKPSRAESYREAQVWPSYDQTGRLLSVEAILDKELRYGDLSISPGRLVSDVRRDLERAGIPYEWNEDESELAVPTIGVSLYAPSDSYNPGEVQAVLVT